jgi:hypothetical protein
MSAEWVLFVYATLVAILSAWLYFRLAKKAGLPSLAALVGLAMICVVPMNLRVETVDFRIWEGGLAVLLGALCLTAVVKIEEDGFLTTKRAIWLSLLAAFTFFVTPPIGLAIYFSALVVMIRHVPMRKWPTLAAISIAALVAVLTPWTIRNYEAFGKFIPMRSNSGLELALANFPIAQDQDEGQAFLLRLKQIHPQGSVEAFERMKAAGGEILWAQQLGEGAKNWIRNHPDEFAKRSAWHLFSVFFAPNRQWSIDGARNDRLYWQSIVGWSISIFALAGALFALARWKGLTVYFAIMTIIPALPYAIFWPVPRYRYLIFMPSVFLAAMFVQWSIAASIALWRRNRQIGQSLDLTPAFGDGIEN